MSYNLNLNSPDLWQTNTDAAITSTSTKIDNGTIVGGPTSGTRLTSKNPVLVDSKPKANKFQNIVPSSITESSGSYGGTVPYGTFLTLTAAMSSEFDDPAEVTEAIYGIVPPSGCKSGKLYFLYYVQGEVDNVFLSVPKLPSGSTLFTITSGENVLNIIDLSDIHIKNTINVTVNASNGAGDPFNLSIRLYFVPNMEVQSKDIVYGVDTEVGFDVPDKSKAVENIRTVKTGTAIRAGRYNINDGSFDVAPSSSNTTSNLTDKENTVNSNGRGLGGRLTYAMQAAPANKDHDAPTL